jgi:hypothetical protein
MKKIELVEDWTKQRLNLVTGYPIKNEMRNESEIRKYQLESLPLRTYETTE